MLYHEYVRKNCLSIIYSEKRSNTEVNPTLNIAKNRVTLFPTDRLCLILHSHNPTLYFIDLN